MSRQLATTAAVAPGHTIAAGARDRRHVNSRMQTRRHGGIGAGSVIVPATRFGEFRLIEQTSSGSRSEHLLL